MAFTLGPQTINHESVSHSWVCLSLTDAVSDLMLLRDKWTSLCLVSTLNYKYYTVYWKPWGSGQQPSCCPGSVADEPLGLGLQFGLRACSLLAWTLSSYNSGIPEERFALHIKSLSWVRWRDLLRKHLSGFISQSHSAIIMQGFNYRALGMVRSSGAAL